MQSYQLWAVNRRGQPLMRLRYVEDSKSKGAQASAGPGASPGWGMAPAGVQYHWWRRGLQLRQGGSQPSLSILLKADAYEGTEDLSEERFQNTVGLMTKHSNIQAQNKIKPLVGLPNFLPVLSISIKN